MTHTTNLGASTPSLESGKSLCIPLHLTFASRLRRLSPAGELKLQGLLRLSIKI
jgi:hypothetical protein